jgi:hypothetical protein
MACEVVIGSAGCDNNHLIGGVDGGGPPASSDAGGNNPDAGTVTPTESWTGYIENFQFSSGSDAVKISFTADAAGHLVGTVKLGNGTPPPPPTDPNVGYPADLVGPGPLIIGPANYVAEGFSYSMLDATISGRRLQFRVGLWELWRDWCALQTPVDTSGGCLPNWGSMISGDGKSCALGNPNTGQYEPVDCGKLVLCGGISMTCRCDAGTSSCTVDESSGGITFDISMSAGLADGSVAGLGTEHNAHFTKDP